MTVQQKVFIVSVVACFIMFGFIVYRTGWPIWIAFLPPIALFAVLFVAWLVVRKKA